MERVFTDINADHGNRAVEALGHGVLLCLWNPLPDSSLTGQEHGRNIPLADIGLGPQPLLRFLTYLKFHQARRSRRAAEMRSAASTITNMMISSSETS